MSDSSPLLPEKVRAALPRLYATEHATDPLVHAKLFTPWAGWTWYITEFDGEDTLFGLVIGHGSELGYISLSELEALKGPGGLRIERDLHFTPRPLSQVRRDLDEMRETPDATNEEEPLTYALPDSIINPLDRPAIRMIETKLTDAWAHACSNTLARPEDAARLLQRLIGMSDREQFAALYLNTRYQLTHAHIVSTGTLNTTPVHPREVFKAGILANAAAIIVGHNHPSGDVAPSAEDNRVANKLKMAGEILGIPVLDALIVGPTLSFYCDKTSAVLTIPSDSSSRPPMPLASSSRTLALEAACRNLLQNIDEVLKRVGEKWWNDTVTFGTYHQREAEKLIGRDLYTPLTDSTDLDDAPDPG